MLDVRAAFARDGFANISVDRAVGLWAQRSVDVSVSGNVERMSQQTSDLLAASGHVKRVVVHDEVRVFPDIKTPRGFICTGSLGGCYFQRLGR